MNKYAYGRTQRLHLSCHDDRKDTVKQLNEASLPVGKYLLPKNLSAHLISYEY
jgi:hypothetical protein